jgi:hypothetical protein
MSLKSYRDLIAEAAFGRTPTALECVKCGSKAVKPNDFRDALSLKEFAIINFCQKCQDENEDEGKTAEANEYPYLFLDIDGVLVTRHSLLRNRGAFEPFDANAVAALNRILDKTKARIVVTSTKRRYRTVAVLNDWFTHQGLIRDRVVDKTPVLEEPTAAGLVIAPTRGAEIAAWLAAHPRVKWFVVIDDDRDQDGIEPARVFLTEFDAGLTDALATKIIEKIEEGYDA